MKTISKIMLAAVLIAGSSAATLASNPYHTAINKTVQTTEDRHLSGFNAVSVSGSWDIYITQGSTESVKVEAPSDVIGKIVTEVDGGTLKIHSKNENWSWNWGNKKIIIYVTAKSLNSITMSGSGDIFFKNGIKGDKLALRVSGSGDITGRVNVNELESSISGSGDIKVSGTAKTSAVKVVGSGDFTGGDLVTQSTMVKVAGSGDARVNASQKVDASVVGSGDIFYTGGATNVSSSSAGSGDIHKF
ncbi:DUF2807 domain-containing protein [Mucilaginibacter sp. UR6-1]|uniref:head GIN domain-containing protein n=1 Tax=Mucilaginibacter sp. UR6-1 TaxID=1435643 RepID=UPI001E3601AD|nr:head GIN domain-containing protein [Mucilaginibacter sp. UR6-1]MCC8410955.1 DUF2807 domain-containing protein [Mucilaginibacter sp. UR6-1]